MNIVWGITVVALTLLAWAGQTIALLAPTGQRGRVQLFAP